MCRAAIEIDGLTRDFGPIRAVDHLSLAVPPGIIYGFLGPNGSGKTTTMYLLLGLLEPTDGRATVLGFDTRTQAHEVRTRVGALLEDSGLYEELSAEDNLNFYGKVWHLDPQDRQSRIYELLTHMGLWDRRSEPVEGWSQGMKRRLALARAVLHHPQLLFLDEPTAGLDVMAATAVREDLSNLASREGVTIFLTTHNMTEAERLCKQIAVIRHGQLVTVGAPDELRKRGGPNRVEIVARGITDDIILLLRAHPGVIDVQCRDGQLSIELQNDTETGTLVSTLVNAGVVIGEVRRTTPSLEDVFVTLMKDGQS